MRREDVILWWMVAVCALISMAALLYFYLNLDGGGGCDELLDNLTDARAEYHRSDSQRDFSKWWDAAHDYCGECSDYRLCDGRRPR